MLVPLYASWTCTRRCSGGDTLPCSLWTPNFAGKASVCVFRACSCLALPIKLFFMSLSSVRSYLNDFTCQIYLLKDTVVRVDWITCSSFVKRW